MQNKRGQVTIFIIISLVIVASVIGYFILRDTLKTTGVPANMEPVYNAFLVCIEEDTTVGIGVLESQGGYMELPEFEPGSAYMPFSSQLYFLGNPIPYWYYISGNNIEKEQVPSKSNMEEQLGNYIESRISGCLLESYLEGGFGVSMGEPEASVDIRDNEVEIDLQMNLAIERANDSVVIRNHNVIVKSNLGSLYEQARDIYKYEQKTLFLENYGIDTLRLYAPVDGVDLSCTPLVWNADEVFDELEAAIEANTLALKVEGGDFSLKNKENRYFVVDIPGVEDNVMFITSRNWSGRSFEVSPTQEGIMMAKPMGNQPGMGALGFCYVPYHFIYDMNYPVLVQVYSGEEIFQFPLAVVIRGNQPRHPKDVSIVELPEIQLCQHKNTLMAVNTYDSSLNPIGANISFECFGEVCKIGETSSVNGSLIALFPQCVNGFVSARAEGYAKKREYINSSAQSAYVDIIMDKIYKKTIQLKLNGADYNKEAIVTFIANTSTRTVVYPEQKEIELSEGEYEVQVYIFRNTSIILQEQEQEQCVEVPRGGLGALFGMSEQKCFDIVIPKQTISNALVGGGTQYYYLLEEELQDSTTIDINAQSLPTPKTIEDLQKNYLEFEDKGLDIEFR